MIAIFVMLFAALIVGIVHVNIGERDGAWRTYQGWFSTHTKMRRLVRGAWQYREMTEVEAEEITARFKVGHIW